jgi:hypothetical protein
MDRLGAASQPVPEAVVSIEGLSSLHVQIVKVVLLSS